MHHRVRLYEASPDGGPAKEIQGFAVTAETAEEARGLARKRLGEWGRTVRAISHTTNGDLAAVVFAKGPVR